MVAMQQVNSQNDNNPIREWQSYSSFGLQVALPGVCDDEGQLQFDERCDGTASKVWR
jgi:hypothetical protein